MVHQQRGVERPVCTGRMVHTEPHRERVVVLRDQPVTIGRGSEGVDHALDGTRVSRRHFRLEPLPEGGHMLVDLGSSNGTFVNDRRVTSVVLEPFDRVRVGDHVLVYLDPGTSVEKVLELMSPGETSHGRGVTQRSVLAERLLALTLLVQERNGETDLVTTLDAVLEELRAWTGHLRGAFLVEGAREPGRLAAVHAQGIAPELLRKETMEALEQPVEEVLRGGHASRLATPLGPDTLCVPLESRRSGAHERRRSHPGEVRGALVLAGCYDEEPRPLSSEELSLLRALTRHVAVVISNARLERQVTIDALTELPNRAHLERVLSETIAAVRRGDHPLGLILLDVDDFKRVNDTFGHGVGDAVLREVASRMRRALRQSDVAGRWGGEEFLVLLPGADLPGAALVAEKVVQAVGAGHSTHTGRRLTVSAGVVAAPVHGLEPRELLQKVDQALYAAKHQGKNRQCQYSPSLASPLVAPEVGDTHTGLGASADRQLELARALDRRGETSAALELLRRYELKTPDPAAQRQVRLLVRELERKVSIDGGATVRLNATVVDAPTTAEEEPPCDASPVAWLDSDLLASIPLRPGRAASLGRDPFCAGVLPHRSVSRRHALVQVSEDGQRITYQDVSRNGSTRNGVAVSGLVELEPGDELQIGPYTLVLRREHPPSPLETAAGAGGINGGLLQDTSLCEVLLELERTRATGRLWVTSGGLSADLFLREGHPIAAQAGEEQNVEVLRRLLTLQRGNYVFVPQPVEEPRQIPFTVSGLLPVVCPAAAEENRVCPRTTCPRERTRRHLQQFEG